MKIKKLITLAILAVMVLPAGIALAETIEGTVASVDLDGNKLEVTKKAADPAAAEEQVSVSVADTTTFSGDAASLAEVVEGDNAVIEADKDATTGNLVAKSVAVSMAEEEAI